MSDNVPTTGPLSAAEKWLADKLGKIKEANSGQVDDIYAKFDSRPGNSGRVIIAYEQDVGPGRYRTDPTGEPVPDKAAAALMAVVSAARFAGFEPSITGHLMYPPEANNRQWHVSLLSSEVTED